MRLVVPTDEGTISFNYTWLPTWIGMNNVLLQELGEKLMAEFKHQPVNNGMLDEMDLRARQMLIEKLKMPSLVYLFDAMRKVEL